MKIHKIILVNINVEKISSEVIALLQTPYFQYLVHPLADIHYLARYVRKSTKCNFNVPLNCKEAQSKLYIK